MGQKHLNTTASTFDDFVQRKHVEKRLYAEHGAECAGTRKIKCDYTKFHSTGKIIREFQRT